MTGELRYLYAVARANAAGAIAGASLRGIEGGPVEVIVEGALLGATSIVPVEAYEEQPLNERLQDLEWLAPRAAAHQEVNGRLLDLAGAVIPLAFGAIYRGTDGVRDLLRTRATEFADRLRAVDGRAEWIVSIEREGSGALEGDAVRVLDAEIAAAAPGRAFLLRKRRDEVARDERRMRDVAVAEEARATIEAIAGVTDPRAVPMVWKLYAQGPPADQAVALQIFGQIDSPSASRARARRKNAERAP